jgi:hypothetical protein
MLLSVHLTVGRGLRQCGNVTRRSPLASLRPPIAKIADMVSPSLSHILEDGALRASQAERQAALAIVRYKTAMAESVVASQSARNRDL